MTETFTPLQLIEKISKKPSRAILLASATGLSIASLIAAYYLYSSQPSPFPGPSGDLFYQWLKAAQSGNNYAYIDNILRTYGGTKETCSVRLFGRDVVISTNLDLLKIVFGAKEMDTFHRTSRFRDTLSDLGDDMLFLTEGAKWRRHRALLSKAFTPRHIRYANQVAIQKCKSVFGQWRNVEVVRFDRLISQVVLDLTCIVLFSLDLRTAEGADDAIAEHLSAIGPALASRVVTPKMLWWLMIPQFSVARMKEHTKVLFGMMQQILDKKKALRGSGEDRDTDDMLDIILDLQSRSNSALSTQEIVDEVIGFILAGSDTTARTLSMTLFELVNVPEIEQKLYAEIIQHLGEDGTPTMEKIAQMPYLDCCVKEILRLHTIGWINSRELQQDFVYDGKVLKKGVSMLVLFESIHRNPKYYKDPNVLRPERWEDSDTWLQPGTYHPFGHGPHACIGEKLAITELKTILVMLLQRYRPLRFMSKQEPRPAYVFLKGIDPEIGLEIEFKKR